MTISMSAVENSSNVDAIGYDSESGELRVKFKNGSTYHCFDCAPEDHEKFITSESKGKFFGALRKMYRFTRVSDEPAI